MKITLVFRKLAVHLYQTNKEMETLKYTYEVRQREIRVVAREDWDGTFSLNYNTPNGYPRIKEFATAKECIKAFNRMTNNQTK